jgi:hypothetical protein
MDMSQIRSINRAVILVSSFMALFLRFGMRSYPFRVGFRSFGRKDNAPGVALKAIPPVKPDVSRGNRSVSLAA